MISVIVRFAHAPILTPDTRGRTTTERIRAAAGASTISTSSMLDAVLGDLRDRDHRDAVLLARTARGTGTARANRRRAAPRRSPRPARSPASRARSTAASV